MRAAASVAAGADATGAVDALLERPGQRAVRPSRR